jgi:hypothetical protein
MRKFLSFTAILCGLVLCSLGSWTANAHPNEPGNKKEAADQLVAVYAEEVKYAHAWLDQYNDVTGVVEILNSLKATNQQKIDQSFQRALRRFFPKSRRVPEMEPWARRKLARFFDFYHLQGKVEIRVFNLDFPMAFNMGQVVGVSDSLVSGWDDEEFAGIVAHEIGHIIAQTQERLGEEPPPTTKAYQRSEEIKADWIAMMMFSGAGLDPKVIIAGMDRIVPPAEQLRAGPLHPPMAVRIALMREWLALPRQAMRLRQALLQISSPAGKAAVDGQ